MFTQQKKYKNRSLVLLVFSLLLLVAMVSACGAEDQDNKGGNKGSEEKEQASNNTSTSQPDLSKEVKTIKTVKGDIEVPVHPTRIVAEEYLGSLIALDVIPVGAPGLTLQNYYFKDSLTGVADTGVYGKPSTESIIGLNPDLIITGNGDSYEQLSKIAPTLFIPYGDLKNAHEELSYFGALLGKEEEAKAWLAKYDERIAVAKAKVDAAIPADATFSIMENSEKTTWVYGDNFGRGGQPVYQALNRKPPAEIADEIMEKQWAEISSEILGKYAGDYIIMTSNNRTIEDYQADPIWGTLPAVKNGKMYVWPEDRSWYYDPLAVLAQTEELAEWISDQK